MAANVDQLRIRLDRARRSAVMLPPHATVSLAREELVDLLELVLVLSDQVRGRGAASA